MSRNIAIVVVQMALLFGLSLVASAQDPGAKDNAKDKKAFQGRWKSDGEPKVVLVFEEDKLTSTDDKGLPLGTATFTVDSSKTPRTIDLKVLTGEDADKTILGLYEVKENELKFIFSQPNGKRPASFDDKVENTFLLLKRVAKNTK